MQRNEKEVSLARLLVPASVLLNAVVLERGFIAHKGWYALLPLTILLLAASIIVSKRWHR